MKAKEREEYETLLTYFLKRQGDVTDKTKIDRLNELGRLSVEDRKNKSFSNWIDVEWVINNA